jgi:hypothetical protein
MAKIGAFLHNLDAGMPDCPAFCQSSTGLKKTNDAATSSVPE